MTMHMTSHPQEGRAATSYIRIDDDPPAFGPSGSGTINFDTTLNGASLHVLPTGIRTVAAGYTVFGINPRQVARYRERYATSGAKSDAADAHLLADMVRTDAHQLRPIAGDTAAAEGSS